jgi:hypothetical protein
MIKYSVCTLNKLIATHVGQEDQNPKLSPSLWYRPLTLLVWHVRLCSSKAWGSGSCKTLSLMFPVIHDHERLKLPLSITPPSQSSNFTSYLSRWGEVLEFLRNTSGCSEGWSFEEMSSSLLQLSSRQMSGSIVTCWCRGVAGQSQESLPSQARELAREAAEWWAKAGIQSRIY